MIWDLEERVEDAVAAYLKTVVAEIRVYVAWGMTTPQFPCVVVHASETGPISENAGWTDSRDVKITLAVMTEAAPNVQSGVEIQTARERNASARADVMRAIAREDLAAAVNGTNSPRVFFSMLQAGASRRTVDDATRMLTTTITLDAIANPTEQ